MIGYTEIPSFRVEAIISAKAVQCTFRTDVVAASMEDAIAVAREQLAALMPSIDWAEVETTAEKTSILMANNLKGRKKAR